MTEVIYITCPLCGMNRVLEKTGASAIARGLTIDTVKGRIRFDHIDLDRAYIVQVRERPTGPETKRRFKRGGGLGFPLRGGFTLEHMRDDEAYADLIGQLRATCETILKILGP